MSLFLILILSAKLNLIGKSISFVLTLSHELKEASHGFTEVKKEVGGRFRHFNLLEAIKDYVLE